MVVSIGLEVKFILLAIEMHASKPENQSVKAVIPTDLELVSIVVPLKSILS